MCVACIAIVQLINMPNFNVISVFSATHVPSIYEHHVQKYFFLGWAIQIVREKQRYGECECGQTCVLHKIFFCCSILQARTRSLTRHTHVAQGPHHIYVCIFVMIHFGNTAVVQLIEGPKRAARAPVMLLLPIRFVYLFDIKMKAPSPPYCI